MIASIKLFFDPQIDKQEVQLVRDVLQKTYEIEVTEGTVLEINKTAYSRRRKQYDGQKLLNELIDEKNLEFFFWIVKDDLYVPVMDFIFRMWENLCEVF